MCSFMLQVQTGEGPGLIALCPLCLQAQRPGTEASIGLGLAHSPYHLLDSESDLESLEEPAQKPLAGLLDASSHAAVEVLVHNLSRAGPILGPPPPPPPHTHTHADTSPPPPRRHPMCACWWVPFPDLPIFCINRPPLGTTNLRAHQLWKVLAPSPARVSVPFSSTPPPASHNQYPPEVGQGGCPRKASGSGHPNVPLSNHHWLTQRSKCITYVMLHPTQALVSVVPGGGAVV